MKRWVFWTGVGDLVLGVAFLFTRVSEFVLPAGEPGQLLWLFGISVAFFGLMLIFCSRDLKHRGDLVIWEGILRLCAAAIMGTYGFLGAGGVPMRVAAIFDLTIGLSYLLMLPRYLHVPLMDLLLDRRVAA
jgi:hypothetical protein